MNRNFQISEDDLVRIFSYKRKNTDLFESFFIFLGRVLLLCTAIIIVYGAINFPAFKDKVVFWYKTDIQGVSEIIEQAPAIGEPVAPAPKEIEYLPEIAENHLQIPSLDITAPISWRIPNVPDKVSLGLQNGVIQLDGTALPGEKGNVYITGHSSNFVWSKGHYNSIFAVINKLVAGDLIYLKYNNKVFAYKVADQKVVAATDLSVLEQNSDATLSLVTCWPIGTSLKRLVIIADQISPNPADNTSPGASDNHFEKLPSGR